MVLGFILVETGMSGVLESAFFWDFSVQSHLVFCHEAHLFMNTVVIEVVSDACSIVLHVLSVNSLHFE
jgi:hypothetical protein